MNNGRQKNRIKYFNIDDIYEDPTTDQYWVERFQELLTKDYKFTNEHAELMLKNSKMSNWPAKFNRKESIESNLEEFKKLSKKIIFIYRINLERY